MSGARWRCVRLTLCAVVVLWSFFDGLAFLLAPGHVLAALRSAPVAPDPRSGVFMGIVLWASLALVSALARAAPPSAD